MSEKTGLGVVLVRPPGHRVGLRGPERVVSADSHTTGNTKKRKRGELLFKVRPIPRPREAQRTLSR